jgi:hypothetical protein
MTEEVAVGGKKITVHGVTPEGFFYLLERFPMLRNLFGGKTKDITMDLLREVAPTSIAFALAVATTDRGRYPEQSEWFVAVEAAAKVAVNLSAHYQMALFQAALRLTFPDGIGPFMKGVEGLANSINRVSGKPMGQDTTSSKRSRSGFVTDSRGMRLGPGAPRENSVH